MTIASNIFPINFVEESIRIFFNCYFKVITMYILIYNFNILGVILVKLNSL